MPRTIEIREFEDDIAASDWANEMVKTGYRLLGVSNAGVSDRKNYRVIVPSIVVTMQYVPPSKSPVCLH